MKHVIALLLVLACAPSMVRADQAATEIDYLLSTIGQSDCVFVRNGKEYAAQDAEAHLRMKYRRAKRYAPTTEKFIERLASKSSMSKKPYLIECNDQQRVPSGQWLTDVLSEYRAAKSK